MILTDGTIINGMFIYQSNVKYSYGDYVIDNDLIFFCNSYEGVLGQLPSTSSSFTEYNLMNSIGSLSDYQNPLNGNKLIPSFLIKSIVNSYVGGLEGNREIISHENGFELNLLTSNYKALVKGDCNSLPLNLNNTKFYILEVYKSGNKSYQKLIDFQTPNMYIRTFDSITNVWTQWIPLMPDFDLSSINTKLQTITSNHNAYKALLDTMIINSDKFNNYKLLFSGSIMSYIVPSFNGEGILKVEISNGSIKKYIDLNFWDETITDTEYSLELIESTRTLTLSSTSYSITKIFLSNHI